jgi:RNA polymerase sigma-70 factor, ECF subfamily
VGRFEQERTAPAAPEEAELLARLRAGDEHAFESLVQAHHGTMIAIAATYVRTRAVAEEVVQDAWLGVVKGLDRFEGRSSLRTWILSILINTARGRGAREARSVPFSSVASDEEREPAVDADRFRRPGEAFAGHWSSYPGD